MRFDVSISYENGATLSTVFFNTDVVQSSGESFNKALVFAISEHLKKFPYDSSVERVMVQVRPDNAK